MPQPTQLKQINLNELISTVELHQVVLSFLNEPASMNQHSLNLKKFKDTVNEQRKILAKKYHPDVGGDLEHMKKVNDACDLLLKLDIASRPEPVVVNMTIRRSWGGGFSTTANQGTSNNSFTYSSWGS